MVQATKQRHEGSPLSFIGDAGALTAPEFAAAMRIHPAAAGLWLHRAEGCGYLYRDEFGRYSSSCPIPRVGF